MATRLPARQAGRARRTGPGRLGRREELAAYLFLIPWAIGLLAFLLIPLLWSVRISMTDTQLLRTGRFIGFANYTYMFSADQTFYHAMWVTVKWLLMTTPLYLVTGIALALLLNQKLRGMNLFRTIL